MSWLSSAPPADRAPPPLVVFARLGAALRLEAVDRVAAERGLAPGLPLADARARVPDLLPVERDRAAEHACLAAVADWCDRWTPLVGIDDDFDDAATLFLDISGVAHLFGGEDGLTRDIVRRLRANGFHARVAVADTADAARALVRHGPADGPVRVVAPGGEAAAVAPLPVAAIDPDAARVARLARLGLDTVGALAALPRAALARRFGPDLLARLDRATGRADHPISPRLPVAALSVERRFLEPILSRDDVLAVARSLAAGLAESLERRGEGLRRAELALYRVDGETRRITVGAGRPIRDPDRVVALLAERLRADEHADDPGFGFDLLRLSVLDAAPADPTQIDLTGDADARLDFETLIDRLGARLGAHRVLRAVPVESHVPEAASQTLPAADLRDRAVVWPREPTGEVDEPPARPPRLLSRPEPIDTVADLGDAPPLRFRWRRALYEVARAEGPERIAVEWWRLPEPDPADLGPGPADADADADGGFAPIDAAAALLPRFDPTTATRDYFRVEDTAGRRFWIFRAGLFARETERPRWFLHGIFA